MLGSSRTSPATGGTGRDRGRACRDLLGRGSSRLNASPTTPASSAVACRPRQTSAGCVAVALKMATTLQRRGSVGAFAGGLSSAPGRLSPSARRRPCAPRMFRLTATPGPRPFRRALRAADQRHSPSATRVSGHLDPAGCGEHRCAGRLQLSALMASARSRRLRVVEQHHRPPVGKASRTARVRPLFCWGSFAAFQPCRMVSSPTQAGTFWEAHGGGGGGGGCPRLAD